MDEPVNGLDPQGIIEIRELILKLNQQHGITILISSHILDELARLSTNYGFIDGGHLLKEMSAEELEKHCRKCIRAEVSSTKTLACVLDEMKLEYHIVNEHTADIFAELSITKLVETLAGSNCEIYSLKDCEESLESFYMNLVGGGKHA